jgi:hypothetical protein
MRDLSAFILLSIFLTSCASLVPAPQTIEVTRQVEITRLVTVSPEPLPARMFFPEECLTRHPGVDFSRYDWFSETIGGCSYLSPSPDGQTVAYSTMVCLEETGTCGEAVRVLKIGEEKPVTVAFAALGEKWWVGYLGWSSTGDLVFTWNDINSGIATYIEGNFFVEDLTSRPAAAQLVPGGLKLWNKTKTAFFTEFSTGEGWCDARISGYDFNTGQLFPDIPALLGLDGIAVKIVYSDVALNNRWRTDTEIRLLITPQEYDESRDDYKFLPTLAGVITLTPSGPVYTTLGSSATENSYFHSLGQDDYEVRTTPYEVKYCQGQ